MTAACAAQATDVAVAWDRTVASVEFYPGGETTVPADAYLVVILDDSDQADALGYHFETPQGRVFARVFAKPTLDGGGKVLDGAESVTSVLSHEVNEALIDPFVNSWADGPKLPQGGSYAYEIGDPVQGDTYPVNVTHDGKGYAPTVSNFVTPRWFDAQAPAGTRVDFMGKCSGPFEMTPGGYMIVRAAPGSEQQVFGARSFYAARNPRPHVSSRSAKRLAKASKAGGA